MTTYTIQLRRDLAANWTSKDPLLAQGELGIETDTEKAKLGDGLTTWQNLAYWDLGGPGGGTFSEPVIINDVPSGAPNSLPVGRADSEANIGLQIVSSYPSDDVEGGTDGTGRLLLYSYQRANYSGFGEVIRRFLMRWDSKAMDAWYGPNDLYDGSGNAIGTGGWSPWAWTGAHYEANDDSSIHGHYEIETPDSTGALQGRFAILFANTTTGVIGLDKTTINTNLADFNVYCHGTTALGAYQQQYFRLTGISGYQKVMEWNNDDGGSTAQRRWQILSTSDAETGSNAGTNWEMLAFDDNGNYLSTPILITRSTGAVQLCDNASTAGVTIVRAGGTNLTLTQTGAAASGIQADMQDTNSQVLAVQIAGDTVNRFVGYSTGVLQWGSGSATRDVNLYRNAAGLLRTDNSLEVATSLGVGEAPVSGHTLDVFTTAAGIMATFTRTSTSDTSPVVEIFAGDTTTAQALGMSVNADSVNRFAIDPTGKHSWGSGSATRDTNLYRSAAGVLRTDNELSVGAGLAVSGTVTGISGQYLCAPKSYAPATQTTLSLTSTTLAAWSSGNVCTNSFTAPASGAVLINASFVLQPGVSGINCMLALAATGTVSPIFGNSFTTVLSSTGGTGCSQVQFYVTGLTAGNTYQFDLLGATGTASDAVTIYAYGATATTAGNKGGPVVMTVQAV